MTILGSRMFTDSWNTIFKLLSGNLPDPGSRVGSPWITSADPDWRPIKVGSPPFPIVVLNPLESTMKDEVFGNNLAKFDVNTEIHIYSRSAMHLDTLSDNIYDTIYLNRNVLHQSGLQNVVLNPMEIGPIMVNNNTKLHHKSFSLNAEYVR